MYLFCLCFKLNTKNCYYQWEAIFCDHDRVCGLVPVRVRARVSVRIGCRGRLRVRVRVLVRLRVLFHGRFRGLNPVHRGRVRVPVGVRCPGRARGRGGLRNPVRVRVLNRVIVPVRVCVLDRVHVPVGVHVRVLARVLVCCRGIFS